MNHSFTPNEQQRQQTEQFSFWDWLEIPLDIGLDFGLDWLGELLAGLFNF